MLGVSDERSLLASCCSSVGSWHGAGGMRITKLPTLWSDWQWTRRGQSRSRRKGECSWAAPDHSSSIGDDGRGKDATGTGGSTTPRRWSSAMKSRS